MSDCFAFLARPESMALLGLLAHGLKKIMRVRRDGHAVLPWTYVRIYPYQTLAALVGTIAGLSALYEMGQLTGVTAFGVGYMANSVADLLEKKNPLKGE